MNKRSSRAVVGLLGMVMAIGASVLGASPAYAAASCSSLSYNYQTISGSCIAANPSSSPYVNIGYSCWGTSHARSIDVRVGYGSSFSVSTGGGCGIFGITGVWLNS